MPKEDTTSRTKRRKKETTLREAVVRHIEEFSDLQGLEAAMKEFTSMEVMFSGNRDWPDIEKEVKAFFLERKRQEQEAANERKQQTLQICVDAFAKKGLSIKQLNLPLGDNFQAPFYTSINNNRRA